jgi:hypothetical protein
MGIGGSIALLVIGAILAFAVRDSTLGGWLDIHVVGWVLILAGLVGLVLTLWVWNSRRTRVVAAPPPPSAGGYVAPGPERRVVEERRVERDGNY